MTTVHPDDPTPVWSDDDDHTVSPVDLGPAHHDPTGPYGHTPDVRQVARSTRDRMATTRRDRDESLDGVLLGGRWEHDEGAIRAFQRAEAEATYAHGVALEAAEVVYREAVAAEAAP